MMLFANTKIPDVLLEQRRLFDYLLMHGDWDTYYVADLSPDQFGDFEELVARYLAEFDDPGLMLPGGWKTHERIWARVQTLKATSA